MKNAIVQRSLLCGHSMLPIYSLDKSTENFLWLYSPLKVKPTFLKPIQNQFLVEIVARSQKTSSVAFGLFNQAEAITIHHFKIFLVHTISTSFTKNLQLRGRLSFVVPVISNLLIAM
jgi:hypothetical protein